MYLEHTPRADILAADHSSASSGVRARSTEQHLHAQLEAVDQAALRITRALADGESTQAVQQALLLQAAHLVQADHAAMDLGGLVVSAPRSRDLEEVLRIHPELTGEALMKEVLPTADSRLASLLGVPLVCGEARLGRLFVANRQESGEFSRGNGRMLALFAERIADPLRIAQRHKEQSLERLRLQLLARTGRVLPGCLDDQETLERIARLAVPLLADWVSVHRWENGRLRLASASHCDPPRELQLRSLYQRFDLASDGGEGLLAQVADSLQAVLVSRAESPFPQLGFDPRQGDPGLAGLETCSCMCVPIIAREELQAVMLFHYGSSGRTYDERDLAMAEEVAQRTALAIDDARHYQQAQAAIRSRDNLIAIVSHDLRNPLNAIGLNLNLLTRPWDRSHQGPDRRGGRARIESIKRSVERLGRMVEDLLAAATLQNGHFPLRTRPEPVEALMGDVVQLFEPIAASGGAMLHTSLPPGLPQVRCDRDRVLQIFSNLCGNALHFTPKSGSIRLAAELDGDFVRFCVSDQGPGIPPSQLNSVFDRFWQGDHASASGVGLGLFIVKGIAEAHGGKAWAQSEPGQGTTFCFTLPVERRASRRFQAVPQDSASIH